MKQLKTALIGFGKIAAEAGKDPLGARHFRYQSHAQVLRDHSTFEWLAVVDPSEEACARARSEWQIKHTFASVAELVNAKLDLEVVVLATPPADRLGDLRTLSGIRAVMVEKPVGMTSAAVASITKYCDDQKIVLQVNYWRRGDAWLRSLAEGGLEQNVGAVQGGHVCYGNGLLNNGSHMVDLLRMLLGEVESVEAGFKHKSSTPLPIQGDSQYSCVLNFSDDLRISLCPLDFGWYRENSIDLWGTLGRLSIVQEGLLGLLYPVKPHRALLNSNEVASDSPQSILTGASDALFGMYDNLAEVLQNKSKIWSIGASAWKNSRIVEAIQESALQSGRRVTLERSDKI